MKARNKLRGKRLRTYNRIEISGQALRANSRFFHTLTGGNVIPVLKGNAYGHGIPQVTAALNVDRPNWMPYLAVDSYAEALQVRQLSEIPVLILGKLLPFNVAYIDQRDFAFAVSDKQTIIALGKTHHHIKLHLELNSGMNRYGISPDAAEEYVKLIQKYPNLELEGVMSHLADSEGAASDASVRPVAIFDETIDTIEQLAGPIRFKHIAQTAGSVRVVSRHANTVRIGVGIYGVNPFSRDHFLHDRLHDIRPSLCLVSTVSQIQEVGVGEGVGYNYNFRAQRPSRIAVLPIGYYEGVPSIFGSTPFGGTDRQPAFALKGERTALSKWPSNYVSHH